MNSMTMNMIVAMTTTRTTMMMMMMIKVDMNNTWVDAATYSSCPFS